MYLILTMLSIMSRNELQHEENKSTIRALKSLSKDDNYTYFYKKQSSLPGFYSEEGNKLIKDIEFGKYHITPDHPSGSPMMSFKSSELSSRQMSSSCSDCCISYSSQRSGGGNLGPA